MSTMEPITIDPASQLLSGWQPASNTFDEVRDPSGNIRHHWKRFFDRLGGLGKEALEDRWNLSRRILRNHGASYHVTTKEGESERPWELDLLPFIISEAEWQHIETGIIQRARLHNLILQDIYARPQYLLRNGDIPPALLFANPNFLRACRGVPIPGNQYLQLHAVDLARSPDGTWWALDDRMQSPNGLGYALENRSIIGRIHRDLFDRDKVAGLSSFFNILRQNFLALNCVHDGYPRVVFLTPGVHSDAHYEHTLLARYLGFTLVEGGDLTVRNGDVFLKTVEGPQKVNVVVRRVNDTLCDPTELDPSSYQGTPGLVQATRMGKVALANALGSAVVETPALLPCLTPLARQMLGQDLLIPNAETWWCGDVRHCRYVLDHLDRLIIKAAFPTKNRSTFSGMELSGKELASLRTKIQARPYNYVGQAPIELSSAPVWNGQSVESRPIVLRVFVAANKDSYAVLPGGLTKVSPSSHTPVKGLRLAGGSKDTWIARDLIPPHNESPIILESRPAGRMQTGVPSRTADNFFWLGRYTERLEHLLQMLRSVATRLTEEPEPRALLQAKEIVAALHRMGFPPCGDATVESPDGMLTALLQVFYQPTITGGGADLCQRLIYIASSLRDRFSTAAWQVMTSIKQYPGKQPLRYRGEHLLTSTRELMTLLSALSGIESENIVRGHEWRFLDFGKRLERSQNLAILMRQVLGQTIDRNLLLNPLLEICDSSMTYRRQHYSEPELESVMSSLLLDDKNPRALKFNIQVMMEHSMHLSSQTQPNGPSQINVALKHMELLFEPTCRDWKSSADKIIPVDTLDTQLEALVKACEETSNLLTHHYFNLA
jgi:uncharacterized circularly permuted ATP-grasp superfamily protein/uncharacterized alpha-E superfamily protein